MILYNGSKYVKGNVFLDSKDNKLTFDKNTKKGKIFITEKGIRIGLTENQVKKLKFSSDYNFYNVEDIPKITGVSIKYYGASDPLVISPSSIEKFEVNTYPMYDGDNKYITGYIVVDIGKVSLGVYNLDFITKEDKIGILEVFSEDLSKNVFNITRFSPFTHIVNDIYLCVFTGIRK